MISIKNLHKNYHSNSGNTHALNNVSFNLPDTGMIFIVGKSGSGKSTLLNILGGLDDFDKGEVIVDGNNLKKMNHKKFNYYRGSYVSFIFQEHFLIDELKVKDNVALSLNIINEHNYEEVSEVLKLVGLESKANNYPLELSGGERQRVAVARAIIKKPKLILCDEPTGNLDGKTTIQVFDTLKYMAKDSLVVVVSHDITSAKKYADRIIELSNGKLVTDIEKNPKHSDKIEIKTNTIVIPSNKILDKEDINTINKYMRKDTAIVLGENSFKEYEEKTYPNRNISLSRKRFKRGRSRYISKIFIFRRVKNMLMISLIISLIIACFTIFMSLYAFDGNKELINNAIKSGYKEMVVRKNYFTDNQSEDSIKYRHKLYSINDSDISKIINDGYNGNIYKIYNYPIGYSETNYIRNENLLNTADNLDSFYARESFGALSCSKDFLEKKFGKLEVIEGSLDDKYGVIITDYMADSLIYNNVYVNNYSEIVGDYYFSKKKDKYAHIAAIIKTDYKEYFENILEVFNENTDPKAKLQNLIDDDTYSKFCKDIELKYGLTYSFSNDFLTTNSSRQALGWLPLRYTHLEAFDEEIYANQYMSVSARDNIGLNSGEMAFNMRYFNQYFGTSYTIDDIDSFTPIEITFRKYYDYTKRGSKDIVGEVKIKVVKLVNESVDFACFINSDDFILFKDISMINYSLMFDDIEDGMEAILKNKDKYYVEDANIDAINLVGKYIAVFKNISFMLCIVLALVGLLYLIVYEISNIKSNIRNIGILKACGMEQRSISKIFIFQQIIVCILTVYLSILSSYVLTTVADYLLISSIKTVAKVYISGLIIVKFMPLGMVFISIMVCFIIMVSCLIPILLLTRIKPMNIIKAKD